MQRYLDEVAVIAKDEVDRGNATRVIQRTGNFNRQSDVSSGMVMHAAEALGRAARYRRRRSCSACAQRTQDIPGVRVVPRSPGGLGGGGKPVQIVMQGAEYHQVAEVAERVMREAEKNPGLSNLEIDYQERQPQLRVGFDRNKAADLGVSLTNIGRALETMLGSRVVTTFQMGGDEYNVVLQARDEQRASVNDLDNIYVRSDRTGELVPLASVVTIQETGAPSELRRFNRHALGHRHREPRARLLRWARRWTTWRQTGARAGERRADPDRLRRRVARAEALGRRAAADLRLRAAHRLPGAGRAVREFRAPDRDPGGGADGADRRDRSACGCSVPPSTSSARSAR